MTPILLSGPLSEPVTLAEAKAWLRIGSSEEDPLVSALVTSARLVVEAQARILLMPQQWRLVLDAWPETSCILLPLRPFLSLQAIRVADASGGYVALSSEHYELDATPLHPRLRLKSASPPGKTLGGIEIDVTCGFAAGAAGVPAGLRQAILLLVARWFENRGDFAGDTAQLPELIGALVAPWRDIRVA